MPSERKAKVATKARTEAPAGAQAAIAWWRERELGWALLASLPFVFVSLSVIDFVPIFDGRIYADCVVRSVLEGPSLTTLRCSDHPTYAYHLWLWAWSALVPGSATMLALSSIVLGVLALTAFYGIARYYGPAPAERTEVILLTAAAGLAPALVANVVQTNPDYGVWAFFVLTLAALLRGRFKTMIAWGVCLVLSKESGLLVYAIMLACYGAAFVTREKSAWPDKRAKLLALAPAVIPMVCYFAIGKLRPVAASVDANRGVGIAWDQVYDGLWRQFLSFSFLDNVWPATLAVIFVMSFAWVPTVIVWQRWLRRGARWLFRLDDAREESAAKDVFLTWLFVFVALALTRYRTYVNPRYFLPVTPLLFLVAWRALGSSASRAKLRSAGIAVFCCLQLVSLYRTADPVATSVFGTFDFGAHRLLLVTSLTKECCGHGRDQLVYNLQFMKLATLTEKVFQELPGLPIAADNYGDFHLHDELEPKTRGRTLDPSAPKTVLLTLWRMRNQPLPPEIWFIDYPHIPSADLEQWLRAYDKVETRTFEDGGYTLPVHRLRRK